MAYLTLEDGTVYTGQAFGRRADIEGEVVFNTGMTGYQEILTDPSYTGQIVTMTYPLIGNYGVNLLDPESARPQVNAFIVRELCDEPSNWRSEGSLEEYLVQNRISGIQVPEGLESVYVQQGGGYRKHHVLSLREEKGFAYLLLSGITDRNQAEELRNAACCMEKPEEDLPEGAYYISDLIGLSVKDTEGKLLGVLTEVIDTGAADVYVVKELGSSLMFPALKRVIVETDIAGKTMTVDAQSLSEVAVYEV